MGATVTVGCKLPHGLILEVGKVQVAINGENKAVIAGGHGVTEGVDKEFWDAWVAAHPNYKPLTSGLIFAHEDKKDAIAQVKERKGQKHGLERLNPEAPMPGIKKDDKT